MSDFTVYFGSLRYATFIPAPKSGMHADSEGRIDVAGTYNGGAFVSSSPASHRSYDMEWGATNKDDLMPLYNMRDGMYGNGLLYFVDPFNNNAMPPHWAEPALTADAWPSLLSGGVKPTAVFEGTTRTNLVTNPSPQLTTTGYSPGNVGTTGVAVGEQIAGIGHSGGFGYRKRWTVAETAATTSPSINFAGSGVVLNNTVVAASTQYTASVWFWSNVSESIRLLFVEQNAAAAQTVTNGSTVAVAANTWTRLSITRTTIAGTINAWLSIGTVGAKQHAIGNAWVIDEAMIEATPTVNTYFDGATRNVDGRTGVWSASPYASASTITQPNVGMPNRSAVYSLTNPGTTAYPARAAVLLTPNGQTLWVGFSGSSTGAAGVFYKPVFIDGSVGPATPVTLLSASGTTRLNMSFDGNIYNAIIFYIDTTVAGASTVTLNSSKSVYAPTGTTPTLTGVHVRGEGHTGLRFSSKITQVDIGVQGTMDTKLISAAVSLTEVGAWM